ncbi:MAG: DUF1570 domain-containing protein [Pirellulaceae bacterium]|nr:DUF1570 domain-containing protein [Planctomycetales bacterium]
MKRRRIEIVSALCIAFSVFPSALPHRHAAGMDYVTVSRGGTTSHVEGRILVEAEDGGVLMLATDGVLWAVQPQELEKRTSDQVPLKMLDRKQLTETVLASLPPGFAAYDTAHYVIFYNTSRGYAQWCGALYERLYRGFYNFWSRRGMKLSDPEMPLIAMVFQDQADYVDHARAELGEASQQIVGYYSLRSNRMMTYDLTGSDQLRNGGPRATSAQLINQVLAQPRAESLVATIIHEATHQLAYNSGLQTRYADNPVWLSEGLAVFFETPDLGNSKGWRTIGAVNYRRLDQFSRYFANRPESSLASLLTDDERLRNSRTAPDAYAESWALCYFLLKKYPREFSNYLSELGKKEPLVYDTPEERLATFRRHIVDDLSEFDAEFIRFIGGVR